MIIYLFISFVCSFIESFLVIYCLVCFWVVCFFVVFFSYVHLNVKILLDIILCVSQVMRLSDIWFCVFHCLFEPAKRLCDASSVLVGIWLLVILHLQPPPLASNAVCSTAKGRAKSQSFPAST